MAETTTSTLSDSVQKMISSAIIAREHAGVMAQICDKQTLQSGHGTTWDEIMPNSLNATAISETTKLDNPQTIEDVTFTLEPAVIANHIVITDRTRLRIAANVFALLGQLGQNAIQRLKDITGLIVLDGASTSLCGAGTTLTSGYLSAAVARIKGNATYPGEDPINIVLHPYQIKDIKDEIIAGVGTYILTPGITADVFTNGNVPRVAGGFLFEAGNIALTGTDAKGGVFAKKAIVIVQGRVPWGYEERDNFLGGGATKYVLYDEFCFGERFAGYQLYEIYSDATAPTS